jgi:hypothetical protein
MKIVENNVLPFRSFAAINLFGVLFVRRGVKISPSLIRHETIHSSSTIQAGTGSIQVRLCQRDASCPHGNKCGPQTVRMGSLPARSPHYGVQDRVE